jgi:hypothetical protein
MPQQFSVVFTIAAHGCPVTLRDGVSFAATARLFWLGPRSVRDTKGKRLLHNRWRIEFGPLGVDMAAAGPLTVSRLASSDNRLSPGIAVTVLATDRRASVGGGCKARSSSSPQEPLVTTPPTTTPGEYGQRILSTSAKEGRFHRGPTSHLAVFRFTGTLERAAAE